MLYPRVLTLVLVVGLLAPIVLSLPPGGASLAAVPVRQADSGNPVELAWVAVRPQDATEPGYLRDRTTDLTLNLIGSFTYEAGPEQDALEAAMGEAGWRDGYYVTLRRPKAEDPESVGQIVSSVIYQFADEAGAVQGFELLADAWEGRGILEASEDVAVGDEAVAGRTEGKTEPSQSLHLLFRSVELVVTVTILDFVGKPALEDVTALAKEITGRIEAARAGKAPGLGLAVWRFPLQGLDVLDDDYQRVAGETIPLTKPQLSPEAMLAEDEETGRLGVLDRYYYGALGLEGTVSHEVVIDRFEDEAAAAAWFAEEPAASPHFQRGADYQGFSEVTEVEAPGDESELVAFEVEGTNRRGYLFRMRVGDRGLLLSGDGEEGLPLDAFMIVANAQATCLEAGICADEEPTAEPTAEPTIEVTAEAGQATAQEATTEPGAAPTEVRVTITNVGFDPDAVVIPVGGTVTWVNGDIGVGHAVAVVSPDGVVETSDVLLPNFGSYSQTFTEPGAYTYVDVSNNAIQGTIIVEPATESSAEDTAEASQEAPLEPTQAAATETYVSPTFGYSLSYDPTVWEVVHGPTTEADGTDVIGLRAGFSTTYIYGIPGTYDAQTCVQFMTDQQTSEANVVAFAPLLDEAGVPEAGGDAGDAFATTRITRVMDDGTHVDQAFYGRCTALPAVGAMVAIQQFAAEAIYDASSAQREQLLEGLTLP